MHPLVEMNLEWKFEMKKSSSRVGIISELDGVCKRRASNSFGTTVQINQSEGPHTYLNVELKATLEPIPCGPGPGDTLCYSSGENISFVPEVSLFPHFQSLSLL
ncbi:hypothetical protein L1987_64462 [Smallanthus sonchifolius]|uniref:Uncharacterized protein n=1 Tax=Smallanthus sonchifolius TaxID=185202 RepID=A0ACB9CGH4_9ASTR|nr:hypothetical protein L1987_64462 [Smallanthus sonchifolius]